MEATCIAEHAWGGLPNELRRPDPAGAHAALLTRVLDEIDYGLILVSAEGELRYANQLGLQELLGDRPLQLKQGRLQPRRQVDQMGLQRALLDAHRGRRSLVSLDHDDTAVSVAVVPMPLDAGGAAEGLALLVFGKRRTAGTLTVDFYARSHGLTGAEANVLKRICGGLRPKEIAREQGVAISTVRTHVCSIRMKTQTGSIRELINRVSTLPPITPVMKATAAFAAEPRRVAAVH